MAPDSSAAAPQPEMGSTRSGLHRNQDQAPRQRRPRPPADEKGQRMAGRVVEPPELRDRREQRHAAGSSDGFRTIAAKRRAGGNLVANGEDIGQRLVEIAHVSTTPITLQYKVSVISE